MSRFEQLLATLRGYASRSCIEGGGSSCTYGQMLEEFECWQSRLRALEIAPGSVVAVQADYSVFALAVLLALLARRAVAALIPCDGDTRVYLRDSCATGLLKIGIEGSYQWHNLPLPSSHPLLEALQAKQEGGIVLFTSGSTGSPKAALHSVERLLHKFRNARDRPLRTLAFLVFDHVAGLDTVLYTLTRGGTLILTRRRDPSSILTLIESQRVELFPASPSFLRMLCAVTATDEHDLSSLKIITYGSELMDPHTLEQLTKRFPSIKLTQKYGTTETGSPRTMSRENGSLWLRINGIDVESKVIDDILWLRSEGATLGYLNAPSPLSPDGWYCTGDRVVVDGEWIQFRGRATDIINVGGQKVAPDEIERTILELDFVRDAVVSGQPHALIGQIVCARVALARPNLQREDAIKCIRAHCRQHLPSYKVPVVIDIISDGFVNQRQKKSR